MKSLIQLVILSFGVAFQAKSAELSAQDINDIKASSKEWVKAYNQNDWKGLADLFALNATMMPPNSVAIIGRPDIASWQEKNESGFRIAFEIQEISGSNHIAYVRGRSCVSIPDGKGGFGIDVGKFLEIRKKQENAEWLIHADIFNSDAALGSELLDTCPFETAQ
jgi:ketosteroid isomerase-like protein